MAAAITSQLLPTRPEPGRSPDAASVTAEEKVAFARALGRVESHPGGTLVSPVRTRLDAGQASEALRTAWRAVTGEEPSDKTVRVLTAQWAHETAHGASMFNYNFGGIKGVGPSGLSVSQRTREGFGETERTITDRFRAYQTAEEGATDYVRLLSKRFPEAVQAARDGDPSAFVHALKNRGYFTGDLGAYTRSVVALSGIELPSSASPAPPRLNAAPLVLAAANKVEPSELTPLSTT
ncbi:MAG TPA: glucosaminidase domain-containing protein, partial [Polyangiaceae bacterium]|nr:glucosaminidase domain-containing protein [Polyangiaceae bacterium]